MCCFCPSLCLRSSCSVLPTHMSSSVANDRRLRYGNKTKSKSNVEPSIAASSACAIATTDCEPDLAKGSTVYRPLDIPEETPDRPVRVGYTKYLLISFSACYFFLLVCVLTANDFEVVMNYDGRACMRRGMYLGGLCHVPISSSHFCVFHIDTIS